MHLIRVDYDLALFLVAARDEQHVVQRRRVVQDALVLEGGEHVACSELDEVDAALVDRQPQRLGPIRSKGLLKARRNINFIISMYMARIKGGPHSPGCVNATGKSRQKW